MSKKRIIAIVTIIVLLFAAGISVGVFLYGRGETQAAEGNETTDQNQPDGGTSVLPDNNGTQTGEGDGQVTNPDAGDETQIPGENAGNIGNTDNNDDGEENVGNAGNAGVTTNPNVDQVGETTITRVEEQERLVSEAFWDWWKPMSVAITPSNIGVEIPQITVKKAAITGVGGDQFIYAGQDITYVIAVTNNSETDVENIEVTDRIPQDTTFVSIEDAYILKNVDGELSSETVGTKTTVGTETIVGVKWVVSIPAGETVIARFTVNVNKDVEGTILNTVIANGEESNEVQTSIIKANKESIITRGEKEVELAKIGDLITYKITVENTGDVEGTTYITDTVPEGTKFVSAQEGAIVSEAQDSVVWSVTVPAGETVTREFVVEVIAVNGLITNVADVGGTDTEADETETVGITIDKEVVAIERNGENIGTDVQVKDGDVIRYTIKVINNGSQDLTNVVVDEKLIGIDVDEEKLNIGILEAGASKEINATYTVTYDVDIKNREDRIILNEVYVSGEVVSEDSDEEPEKVEDEDDVTTIVEETPLYTATKTTDKETVEAAGEVITYTITVTNIGNTPVTVPVVDEMIGVDTEVTVNVGETKTVTGTYTVTQADIDNGKAIKNVATVGDKTPEIEVEVNQKPGYTASKTADKETVEAAGEVITYTITVTNTGNTTLTLPVVDEMIGVDTEVTVNVGETKTVTGTYTVTQADIDNGVAIKNVATVGDKTPEIEVEVNQKPGYTASKTADKETVEAAGEVITYTITVTNTGNTTLTLPVVDEMINVNTEVTVNVGETKTVTGTYTVTQADIDSGKEIKNVAIVGDKTPEIEVEVNQKPGYTASKTADKETVEAAGEVITYTITVTNTGNTTLTLPVVDEMIGVDTEVTVNVGETKTVTGTYTVTQADIDSGKVIKNVATVGDKTPEIEVEVEQKTGYTATKTADKETVEAAGEVITYTITVTNTGNTTIKGLAVKDEMINVDTTVDIEVGKSATVTGTYTVTQADIDSGKAIKNIATVGDKTPEIEVEVEQKPGYTATKTADKETVEAAGEVITYTITVTNTGNTTVKVPVVDEMINVNTEVTVNVGEAKTVTGTYTVTQADIDNGKAIKNIATVGDKTPEIEVEVEQKPGFETSKTADKETVEAAGEVITYTITVTNTGNTTLILPVVDEMIGVDTEVTVNVGDTKTVTGKYTVTQADIDSGKAIKNVATVGDKNPEIEVEVEQKPGFETSKTADKEKVEAAGEVITYTITVTNIGNTTVTVPVVDEMINVNTEVTVNVGETKIVTGTYTVTQADIDNGKAIKNVATVGDKNPEEETPVVQNTSYTATKTADKETVEAAGEVVTYTITVTNTGNTTVTVPVVDEMINVNTEVVVPVGESREVSGTYTVTQADIDSGKVIKNVATVGDKTPEIEVEVEQKPGFETSKTADKETVEAAGEVITYTITVTNTGNTTLTLPVVDEMIGVNTEVTVNVGETKTVTGTYTVTQADIDNGVAIKNVATVGDKEPEIEVEVIQKPGYIATKTADKEKVEAAGEVITYTITVTNIGNTTVTVPVVDEMINVNTEVTVNVGETKTVTGTYTVTQADIDNGVAIKNVATVGDKTPEEETPVVQNTSYTATKIADKETVEAAGDVITYTITVTNTGNTTVKVPVIDEMINVNTEVTVNVGETKTVTGTYTVTQSDIDNGKAIKNIATVGDKTPEIEVEVIQKPGYTASKTADKETVEAAGEVITYTITVKNTGNTTIKGLAVKDEMINVDTTVDIEVGKSATVTGTYTVTQADIDNGTAIKNVATVGDKTPEIEVEVIQKPGYTATKTADKETVEAAGEVITYTITVTNTGNTTIKGLAVKDEMINIDTTVDIEVGKSATVTGTYTVTQADIDNGKAIKNVATVGDKTPEIEVEVDQKPGYTASKTADKETVEAAGEVITYTITVTNTGNTTVKVPVVDEMIEVNTEVTVNVGESKTVTGTYTVKQADIDNGKAIKNVATVGDKTPEIEVEVDQKPGYTATKTADKETVEAAGEVITYTITVTNTGNTTLTLPVIDEMIGVNTEVTVNVGETKTVTGTYTVTQADIDNGKAIKNVATVGDKTPEIEVEVDQKPGYTATKTADKEKVEAAGEVITYTITVTNTGNTTVKVPVVDEMIGVNTEVTVNVGETKTITGTYTVTQADIDNGKAIKNIATVGDKEPEIEVEVEQKTGYTATKTADKETVEAAGEVITYTITVTNTGNTTVKVPVVDEMINVNTEVTVNVGETKTVTGTYTITQADIDNGTAIKNVATVGDKTPEIEVSVEQKPAFETDKTATLSKKEGNTSDKAEVGDVITYTITVTNTGNVTLENIVITDEMLAINETKTIQVGSVETITKQHTITSQDIEKAAKNNGVILNIATATYGEITDSDDATTEIRMKYSYTVEYYYEHTDGTISFEGKLFVNDSSKTEEITAEYGEEINEYTDNNITGYELMKAVTTDIDGKLPLVVTEITENNVIKVYYIKKTYNYKVEYYLQNLDGTWPSTPNDTDSIKNVTFGENATYDVNSYTGFTYNASKTVNGNTTVPANNDLVIKLYYDRNNYDYVVNYLERGTNRVLSTQKVVNNLPFGTVITSSNEVISIIGYNYHSVDKTTLTIGAGSNVINIYYTENVRTATVVEKSTTIRKTNLVLVLDLSSSMTKNGSSRLADAKAAANKFIDQIYNNANVTGINIRVVTFNSRNPIIDGDECSRYSHSSHYEWINGIGWRHKSNENSDEYDGCVRVNGEWYSSYSTVAYSGTQVLATTLANNTATNYTQAQTLKTAINAIAIPNAYINSGYGTHIYAALQEANTQITNLKTSYPNNDNVVVFLGDGDATPTGNSGYGDNSYSNIQSAGATLKGKATVYCIRLGNEAQSSTVFGYIASGTDKILDANTQGDLINGFNAITSSESSRTDTANSSNGIITIVADLETNKPITVTKPDGTAGTYNSISELNASGFITYNTENKTFTWNVLNYSNEVELSISYSVK